MQISQTSMSHIYKYMNAQQRDEYIMLADTIERLEWDLQSKNVQRDYNTPLFMSIGKEIVENVRDPEKLERLFNLGYIYLPKGYLDKRVAAKRQQELAAAVEALERQKDECKAKMVAEGNYLPQNEKYKQICVELGNRKQALRDLHKVKVVDALDFYKEMIPLVDEHSALCERLFELQMEVLSKRESRSATAPTESAPGESEFPHPEEPAGH